MYNYIEGEGVYDEIEVFIFVDYLVGSIRLNVLELACFFVAMMNGGIYDGV